MSSSRLLQLLICKPAGWREEFADPTLPGWTFVNGVLSHSCDGDVLKAWVANAGTSYYNWKKTLTAIDCTVYKRLLIRYRIVSYSGPSDTYFTVRGSLDGHDKHIEVSPFSDVGEWKIADLDVYDWGSSNTEIRFYIYNSAGGYDIELEIDFVLLTTEEAFFEPEDLDDVFDIPRYVGGLNGYSDSLMLIINNESGRHKDRFAYRDEVYLWLQKGDVYHRIFGGTIDSIDPESIQYGEDYLTLNMLGWSALLNERMIAETYQEDEDANDVVKDILDKAEKQASLGFTTFGVKDVQKGLNTPLKCDYDKALKKLAEMAEDLNLCVHVEPNRDVSLYPAGKRFLRWAGWMDDTFETGWTGEMPELVAEPWSTDGDIASLDWGWIKRKPSAEISVDTTIYKYLIVKVRQYGANLDDAGFYLWVQTEDDADYLVQPHVALTDPEWQIRVYDLTPIITGGNKTVQNLTLGALSIIQYDWVGFFASIPIIQEMTGTYSEVNFECEPVPILAMDMQTLTPDGRLKNFSKYDSHGAMYGTEDIEGKIGRARYFDGVNDYVDVTPEYEALQNSVGTWMFWIWIDPSQNDDVPRILRKAATPKGWEIAYTTADPRIAFPRITAGGWTETKYVSVSTGVILHYAATVDDQNNVKIYLNGDLKHQSTWSAPIDPSSDPLKIGGVSATSQRLKGWIDEPRISPYAMTQDEIRAEMEKSVHYKEKIPYKVGTLLVNEGDDQFYLLNQAYHEAVSVLLPPLTKDLANDKYEEIFYLVSKEEKISPTVIYEDDESIFTVGIWGSGSLNTAVLTEETSEVEKGDSSLKIAISTGGTVGWMGARINYGSDQDWSAKDFICLWVYGLNNSGTIHINVGYAPNPSSNYTYWTFTDNFSGWRRYVLPLMGGNVVGSRDLTAVRQVNVVFNTAGDRYLDQIHIDVGQWVKVEFFVPDLLDSSQANERNCFLYSWDGNNWQNFLRWAAMGTWGYNVKGSLYFLDGTTDEDIYGVGYTPASKASRYFTWGERGEEANGYNDTIQYSSYYGTLKRVAFAIKMPPSTWGDDGRDDLSGPWAINKTKLKLEINYVGTPAGSTTIHEPLRLDAVRNVKAGAFLRDPKKSRNMIIVKGDKFSYNIPRDADEWTKEPAPTVIEEDNVGFWSVNVWDSGTIGTPVVSADTTEKMMGGQSTKVVVGSGSYQMWIVEHSYSPHEDWSRMHYIFFWFYGANTGGDLRLGLDCPDWANSIVFQLKDDFTGWQLMIFNLDDATWISGDPDLSDVAKVWFSNSTANLAGTWRFDEVVICPVRYAWGASWCTLTNDPDAKAGIYSLKAELEEGVLNNFYRLSSGLIDYETFTHPSLVVWEDDLGFWTGQASGGAGSFGTPYLQASGTYGNKATGLRAARIFVPAGSYDTWIVKHVYGSNQDWSSYSYLGFWENGQGNDGTKKLRIAAPDWSNYFEVSWTDDEDIWQFRRFALSSFSSSGSPSWSTVKEIRFEADNFSADSYVIDHLILDPPSWDESFWIEQAGNLDQDDESQAYVESNKLVCRVLQKSGTAWKECHTGLVTKAKYDLTKGYVFETKITYDMPPDTHEHAELRITDDITWIPHGGKDTEMIQDPEVNKGIQVGGYLVGEGYTYSYEHNPDHSPRIKQIWSGKNGVSPVTIKLIVSEDKYKCYVNGDPVYEVDRDPNYFGDVTEGYVWLDADGGGPSYNMSVAKLEKFDYLKIYKDYKIYVEGLAAGWKVELWSGTYASPGSLQADAVVPAGSTIAELDVHALDFPFTGFFKVFDTTPSEDHHSPDYSDIWGGDHYKAKQVAAEVEHLIYFPRSKDLALNALSLKRLKFWMKHDVAGGGAETARIILATDDDNYYYTDFAPVSKWKELFEFDVGWIQNILFEEVGTPSLKNLNWIGFLYPKTSAVTWLKIDEFRFEGETECWGIARDEDKIGEYGLQPEKVTSSFFKTPVDAQKAAEYFLNLLKDPPLVKGSLVHPWGLPQVRAGDSAIVNVPNQNVSVLEMTIKEVVAIIPPSSTKFTTEVDVAGLPHAITDPQKQLEEYITRLQKADVYAQDVELFATPLMEGITLTDTVSAILSKELTYQADVLLRETLLKTYLADTKLIEKYVWEEFNNMNDWTTVSGTWSVSSGWLKQTATTGGRKLCKYTGSINFPIGYFVKFLVKFIGSYPPGASDAGFFFRVTDWTASSEDAYEVALAQIDDEVNLGKFVNGSYTNLASVAKTVDANTEYTVKMSQYDEDTGVRFKIWFNGESSPCINYLEDPKTQSDGEIGFMAYAGTVDFDYIYQWDE